MSGVGNYGGVVVGVVHGLERGMCRRAPGPSIFSGE
jgi:hypothetical protein